MFAHSPALAPLDYASAAVVGPGTRLVLSAGACPLGADGTVVAPGDVTGQARKGARQPADRPGRRRRRPRPRRAADRPCRVDRPRRPGGGEMPAATLLGVAVLGHPEQLVEVDAVAAVAA